MPVEEQDKLAISVCTLEKKLKSDQKGYTSSFPAMGKVICVVEERLEDLKSSRKIAKNTSLSSFWESITKVKDTNGKYVRLNNHGLSCAVAFGTFVRSELISEEDYNKNTSQCLELAASISTAVGGEIQHDAVVKAANELRDRSKNSAQNLRNILESVKDPTPMTVEQAQKALAKIIAGGHMGVAIAGIGAEIAHTKDGEVARNAYLGLQMANDMFIANTDETGARRFSDDVIDAWHATYLKEHATKPEEKPAAESTNSQPPAQSAPAAETPGQAAPAAPDKLTRRQRREAAQAAETPAAPLAAAA